MQRLQNKIHTVLALRGYNMESTKIRLYNQQGLVVFIIPLNAEESFKQEKNDNCVVGSTAMGH